MLLATVPVSLKELLAIPLSNLKTIAKWLVISSILSRKRERRRTHRYATLTITRESSLAPAPVLGDSPVPHTVRAVWCALRRICKWGELYVSCRGHVNGGVRVRLIDEAAFALVADGEDECHIVRGIVGI